MAWSSSIINNIDFAGAEVIIEGRNIGSTLGDCTVKYTPSVRQYYAGYPSRIRGSEITSERLTCSFGAIELTPDNLALSSPSSSKTSTTTQDTIHLGTSTQPAVYTSAVIHKYNPANGKHYVLTLWRVQVTSGLTFTCAHDSTQIITINVEMEALATTGHGTDALGVLEIYDTWPTT